MNMRIVMSQCADFQNERSALQERLEARGHILLMPPKYHPELAGVGIEYSWGRSKHVYRHELNDKVSANLRCNVEAALSVVDTPKHAAVRPISLVRKSARRARAYRKSARRARAYERAYRDPSSPSVFQLIEHMKKPQKSHRSIGDLDPRALLVNEEIREFA